MAQMNVLNTFTPSTKIKSSDVNANFTEIRNKYNDHDEETTDVHGIVTPSVIVGTDATQTLTNKTINNPEIKSQQNTEISLSSNTIDFDEGDSFTHSISTNTSYTITNIPASGFKQFTLLVTSTSGATVSFTNDIKTSYNVAFASNANVTNLYTICAINGVLYGNCLARMS